jgi:ribosomal-protein-alanine N-acetyltransferase
MRIRLATETDLPQLTAISEAASSAAHWTPQQWSEVFSSQTPVRLAWIAEWGPGDLAREVGLLVAQNCGPEWELENVAVLPDFRRRGVGLGLLSVLLAQAHAAGGERILLEVRASNLPAIHLYTMSGFRTSGVRRDYYRNPVEDALVLVHTF